MQDAEAARFTLLDRGAAVDDDRVRALYAYPDPRPDGWVVRANAIAGLDGAATTAGTSGGLGGAGDRHLFGVLREMADVIVVGAGTVRAENYGGARMTVAQRRRRRDAGIAEVPPIALVTRTGVLAPDLTLLTDTEVPPLVLTCTDAASGARRKLGSTAEVIDCSSGDPTEVDLPVLLTRLAERGLPRVLAEGGPSLLGAFLGRGLLDEMCLTSAPLLVGGTAIRIVSGTDESLTAMRRAHTLADAEGYLYSRYVRTVTGG